MNGNSDEQCLTVKWILPAVDKAREKSVLERFPAKKTIIYVNLIIRNIIQKLENLDHQDSSKPKRYKTQILKNLLFSTKLDIQVS